MAGWSAEWRRLVFCKFIREDGRYGKREENNTINNGILESEYLSAAKPKSN